jgi:hypothetical protein
VNVGGSESPRIVVEEHMSSKLIEDGACPVTVICAMHASSSASAPAFWYVVIVPVETAAGMSEDSTSTSANVVEVCAPVRNACPSR